MAKHAQLKWTGGLQFIGRAGDSPAVVIDNPEGGSGPSPMDLVLMGVAACTATSGTRSRPAVVSTLLAGLGLPGSADRARARRRGSDSGNGRLLQRLGGSRHPARP